MTTKKKTKKPSNTAKIVEELQRLNDSVDDLYDLVDRAQKKARKTKVGKGILNGLLQAVGLIIGTLVMTALLVYLGQLVVRSDAFQSWLEENLRTQVTEIIFDQAEESN